MKFYTRDAGHPVGRARVGDVAFQFRMGAGFAGDINRTHPVSVSARKMNATNPPTSFGQAVLYDGTTNSARAILVADNGITQIAGVTARPYPTQDPGTSAAFGAAGLNTGVPAINQPVDVVEFGYILVPVVGTPALGGAVFIWTAAASGSHIVGGFEAAASAGNTSALATANYFFNGPPDVNGLVELAIRL